MLCFLFLYSMSQNTLQRLHLSKLLQVLVKSTLLLLNSHGHSLEINTFMEEENVNFLGCNVFNGYIINFFIIFPGFFIFIFTSILVLIFILLKYIPIYTQWY